MKKFFVDTSVLTEVLLKKSAIAQKAKAVLANSNSELPVIAIREFKAGPLSYHVWLHNKLAVLRSLAKAILAIQAVTRNQPYRASTALEALSTAMTRTIASKAVGELAEKYGEAAKMDSAQADELRVHIRRVIAIAWGKRRAITTSIVCPLSCYQEVAPVEKRGLLELTPNKCMPPKECCLAPLVKRSANELELLRAANQQLPQTRESQRRGKVLKELTRRSDYLLDEHGCRDLGDALFSLLAPKDATILTTNIRDHKPLAESLGKHASTPQSE